AIYSKEWKEWWKAISTEFYNMEAKGVWDICLKSKIPANRKVIGNRWVFSKKDDGRFRARTVAQGFSQIPGKDFQENYAPVVNDTTFRLTLVLKVLLGLESGQFDVETAFLYGDLDEELWMELPEGYDSYTSEVHKKVIKRETHCVRLKKALYGLVQAARQWWKKFKEVMASIDFHTSAADPCLFIKQEKEGEPNSFVIIYVDDGGIIGTERVIKDIFNALSKDFKMKNLGKMEHFVGCHLIENSNRDTIWIHQPKLIKNLKAHFGNLITTTRTFPSPASPKTVITRPKEGDPTISPEDQKKFRSGVGMLLYLVKHSRPDISNAVRELSKVADGATKAHWKALMRAIKFVMDTENYGLRLKPKVEKGFYLEGISDSEYAGDRDTRISVYGYILYFCGCPIAWKSKSGKSVTLSSTEAEYFATSEVAKEVIFAKQVLESIGIPLSYPIEIKCDNIGAIYLANNHSTSQRTKHIDTRTHFVREFVEQEILKVVFVKSEDNEADIFTKNTTEELFRKHMSKNVEEVEAGDNLDGHIANIHYLEEEIRNEEYVSNCMAFLHFVNEETVNICTNNIDQSST
ncbi:MAG TPA: reverse transcriptase domain-containing protein, partial [Fusibacter sp.]|nr:reverse transcriptase domain-containing protein [Fusibacter sp.]